MGTASLLIGNVDVLQSAELVEEGLDLGVKDELQLIPMVAVLTRLLGRHSGLGKHGWEEGMVDRPMQ
ncbi:MAG TPA: hypothetical protein PKY77_06715 [Phycisphaerae bacterium]|nr:hypothetical protein [Phycisphaerae bacterium]